MNSISSKEQRLLFEFVSNEAALKENIDAFIRADDDHTAHPTQATRRKCNQLRHQHYQRLHRRDASWLRLIALFAARGALA